MDSLTLFSPAKLNLVLDILGQRPDGFHELKTVFERINLRDEITLMRRSSGKIRVICANPQVPKGAGNLVVRMAMLLKRDLKIQDGVDIHIVKNIPVAAGLAGGSSNAATVLMGLNRLWQLGLSQKKLESYAAQLGSDINFFLHDSSYGLGSSRGEVIKPLAIKTKLWHVLVTPKVKMLTKDVYGLIAQARKTQAVTSKLKLTNKRDNVNILLPFLRRGNIRQLGGALSNDLEPAILSLRPDFIRFKNKFLDAGAVGVCFSGSGPSVFALAESQKHAEAIKAKCDGRLSQVFVVSTL